MDEKVLVGVEQAARALGMGRSSLYRLAKTGRVPSYSAGPRMSGVRFSIPEVMEALRRPVETKKSAK